jgi:hypothetical protein
LRGTGRARAARWRSDSCNALQGWAERHGPGHSGPLAGKRCGGGRTKGRC